MNRRTSPWSRGWRSDNGVINRQPTLAVAAFIVHVALDTARNSRNRAHHRPRVNRSVLWLHHSTRTRWSRRTYTVREASTAHSKSKAERHEPSRNRKGSAARCFCGVRMPHGRCAALCLAGDRATMVRSRSRLSPLHSSLAVLSRLTAPFSCANANGKRPRHATNPHALRGRQITQPLHPCSESPRPCPTLSGWSSCRSLRRASASSAPQLARVPLRVPPRVPPPPPCGCHPYAHQSQPRPAVLAVPGRH